MKIANVMFLTALSAVAITAAALGGRALSAPSASPSPKPSASASAPPRALPTLNGEGLPATPSSPPAEADWASATEVGASRGALSKDCKAKLVREWLRVTCVRSPGVGLVAGDPALVKLRSGFQESPLEMTSVADVAVRRGASTIVSFVSADIGTTSVTAAEGLVVQVGWRDGEPHPLLVSHPPRPAK
jgi:hypothetical protein